MKTLSNSHFIILCLFIPFSFYFTPSLILSLGLVFSKVSWFWCQYNSWVSVTLLLIDKSPLNHVSVLSSCWLKAPSSGQHFICKWRTHQPCTSCLVLIANTESDQLTDANFKYSAQTVWFTICCFLILYITLWRLIFSFTLLFLSKETISICVNKIYSEK